MFDVTLENRLPPLVTSAEVEISGPEVEIVHHNGLPVLGPNGLVFSRFSAVVHNGAPVLNGEQLVIASRS